MIPFVPSQMVRTAVAVAVLNLFAYSYVDPAAPVFTQKYGATKANGRFNQAPLGKRIVIDGTTSTNGNYHHVASLAAAVAIYAAGDWILFPGGQTVTGQWVLSNLAAGVSATQMSVFGTFDPADKENDAKFNTLYCTVDWTSVADGVDPCSAGNLGGNMAFINFKFISPLTTTTRLFNVIGSNSSGASIADNLLFENCVFNGINVVVNSGVSAINQGYLRGTITRSGSVATFTLETPNALLVTGDKVITSGAGQAAYNIDYPGATITVLDSSHFTFVVAGSPTTPATGANIGYAPAFSRIPDSFCRNDVTFRYCGSMNGGNGTSSGGKSGGYYLNGIRRWRFEACVDDHGGYGIGITRSTAVTAGGPSIFTHSVYVDDYCDGGNFLDCMIAHDSSNMKITGGSVWLQNHASVRNPISWIFSANGNDFVVQPNGSLFQCTHHLAMHADDINYTDGTVRGQGPDITQSSAGSYVKHSVMLNNDAPGATTNRFGIRSSDSGGFTGNPGTTLLVDDCLLAGWDFQDPRSAPDAFTANTFTNMRWDSPTAGSNTKISDLSVGDQAKIAAALALNVHTTFRLAFPAFFSGVTVGGTDRETEDNMVQFMCNNPIPDPTKAMGWAIPLQYHVRAVLA